MFFRILKIGNAPCSAEQCSERLLLSLFSAEHSSLASRWMKLSTGRKLSTSRSLGGSNGQVVQLEGVAPFAAAIDCSAILLSRVFPQPFPELPSPSARKGGA
jgi:hypothetical protein